MTEGETTAGVDPQREEAMAMFHLGLLVIRARRLIRSSVLSRLEELGESMGEWPILSHLARTGSSSQRDLATAIAIDPATVCRTLEDMEGRGLVERNRDENDRRRQVVDLSNAGRQTYERLLPEVGWSMGESLDRLTQKERQQLEKLLKKLLGES